MLVNIPAQYVLDRFLATDISEVGVTAAETINKAARLARFAVNAMGPAKASISLNGDEVLLLDTYLADAPQPVKARRTKGAS